MWPEIVCAEHNNCNHPKDEEKQQQQEKNNRNDLKFSRVFLFGSVCFCNRIFSLSDGQRRQSQSFRRTSDEDAAGTPTTVDTKQLTFVFVRLHRNFFAQVFIFVFALRKIHSIVFNSNENGYGSDCLTSASVCYLLITIRDGCVCVLAED